MPFLGQHLVQRPCLLERARKPVQEDAGAGLCRRQAPADDADDKVVRDEVTGGHDARDLIADLGSTVHLGSKDGAGRKVGEVELVLDARGLRALAASRWAEDDADHDVLRRSGMWNARRRRHQSFECSFSSASTAGSGPEASPLWLILSQRCVICT